MTEPAWASEPNPDGQTAEAESAPGVNFFDFDRTITRTDTIKFLLIALAVTRPMRIPHALVFIARSGGRTVFTSDMKHTLIGMLVRGRKVGKIDAALRIYSFLVKRCLRKEVFAILRRCQDDRKPVVVGTASPEFAVKAILARFHIEVVGTTYEIVGDRFTGGLDSPVCIGEEKLQRITAWMKTHGIAGMENAYSDHHSDLPLLRSAEKAVFVYPDRITAACIDPLKDEVIMGNHDDRPGS